MARSKTALTFQTTSSFTNPSAFPEDAGNTSVTDDPLLPRKFVIPAGTTIPAGGYLILWCDLNTASPGLHTGFGLGANTDRVQLFAADGATLLDDISFGIAVADLSIGRIPNGSGAWTLEFIGNSAGGKILARESAWIWNAF